jgi:hypothetical protein
MLPKAKYGARPVILSAEEQKILRGQLEAHVSERVFPSPETPRMTDDRKAARDFDDDVTVADGRDLGRMTRRAAQGGDAPGLARSGWPVTRIRQSCIRNTHVMYP